MLYNKLRLKFVLCIGVITGLLILNSCDREEQVHEYNIYEADDSVEISNSVDHLNDIVQYNLDLYLATDSGLYVQDIDNGEIKLQLLDCSIDFIERTNEEIYAYSSINNKIYNINGNTYSVKEFDGKLNGISAPSSFAVTNDYLVLLSTSHAEQTRSSVYYIIDKKSGNVEQVPSNTDVTKIFTYTGNQILMYYYARNSVDCYITAYNIDNDKIGEKYYVNMLGLHDAVYHLHTDSLYIYTVDNITFKMTLKQYSFKEKTLKSLKTYPINGEKGVTGIITSSDNLISCGIVHNKEIQIYDIEKEYSVLNIALYGYPQSALQYLLSTFKDKHNIDINLIQYNYDDKDKLNMKLQAGDSDIDLYYTFGLDTAYYVLADIYTDLNTMKGLKENINRCESFINAASMYEEEIFGIPTEVFLFDSTSYRKIDGSRQNNAVYQYLGKYIDLTTSSYLDTEGKALAELFQYFIEFPNDDAAEPLFGDFKILLSDYIILNPNAEHIDEAVMFLNEVMNLLLGDYNDELNERQSINTINLYPELEEYSGIYNKWKCYNHNIFDVLSNGIDQIIIGANIEKIARECASKIDLIVKE